MPEELIRRGRLDAVKPRSPHSGAPKAQGLTVAIARSQHRQRCRPSHYIPQFRRGYRPDRPFRLIADLYQLD